MKVLSYFLRSQQLKFHDAHDERYQGKTRDEIKDGRSFHERIELRCWWLIHTCICHEIDDCGDYVDDRKNNEQAANTARARANADDGEYAKDCGDRIRNAGNEAVGLHILHRQFCLRHVHLSSRML